jgi:peptidoglycan-associated lipoprotein
VVALYVKEYLKKMKKWRDLTLIILGVFLLADCTQQIKTGEGEGTLENNGVPIITKPTPTPCETEPCNPLQGELIPEKPETEPPKKRLIHFNSSSNLLTPETRAILEEHAKYLKANPLSFVRLEGHTDERGSREYNLALAEQRVLVMKEMLKSLGVNEDQLMTLSYGEERPASLGHGEKAWRQNRRVEFVYP